ncbi:MAG: NAD(+)--dinitrogen-reductase ADP-D-ribosyltransferase [Rhodospirillaceae bacterium]|nr:NAD(+)--dinitrogen-reductase ADP-D-ribosyltransferase [Rhodospirillaceae bacterium]
MSTASGQWQLGHSTNLVGVPTAVLAASEFNDDPRPLSIAGVRQMHHELFARLAEPEAKGHWSEIFEDHMAEWFDLPKAQGGNGAKPPKRYYASYLRLLRGWAFDNNAREGAVLKGWVESRFGLFPTFHREPITRVGSPAWAQYVEDKMACRFYSAAVLAQLDLLYEFAQWVLARAQPPRDRVTLYRGVNDFSEHQVIDRIDKRTVILRLNNLVSFTAHRDMASWFGDHILETAVPLAKILFFKELLPRHALKGEGEVLVIGGDYRVQASYF